MVERSCVYLAFTLALVYKVAFQFAKWERENERKGGGAEE